MIDVSKIRVGDEVTVRGRVAEVDNRCGFKPIRLNGGSWVHRDDILAHTPAPRQFKPGDRALDRAFSGTVIWFIVHTKDGWAWVEDANGWQRLAAISDLRHADESE